MQVSVAIPVEVSCKQHMSALWAAFVDNLQPPPPRSCCRPPPSCCCMGILLTQLWLCSTVELHPTGICVCRTQGSGVESLVRLLLHDASFARAVQQKDGEAAAAAAVGLVKVRTPKQRGTCIRALATVFNLLAAALLLVGVEYEGGLLAADSLLEVGM